MDFKRKQPCNNCPYRTDAPLKMWDISEFKKLFEQDEQQFGAVWGCHKKDGHICVGYLIDQEKKNFPNLNLRILLIRKEVDRTYLDKLSSPYPLYRSVAAMIKKNYPKLLKTE